MILDGALVVIGNSRKKFVCSLCGFIIVPLACAAFIARTLVFDLRINDSNESDILLIQLKRFTKLKPARKVAVCLSLIAQTPSLNCVSFF